MIVHLYSTMRNEEKILPYFFRHYDQFVSHYFVWEDHSEDNTRQMLVEHGVTVVDAPYNGIDEFIISNCYSEGYKPLSRGYADWVICADADEFLYHHDMIGKLDELKRNGVQAVVCEGRQMISDHFPETNGQIYDDIKTGVVDVDYNKCILFNPVLDMNFVPGRHWTGPGSFNHRLQMAPGAIVSENIGILNLHYACLGLEYVKQRHAKNACRQSPDNLKNHFDVSVRADSNSKSSDAWFAHMIEMKGTIECL